MTMNCGKKFGVTLIEILCAVALLAFSFVGLLVTFQGIGQETPFTAAHYSAMFLAQKILEDINGRISENPHAFTDLIMTAEGKEFPVVPGESPYFKLLENTRDFNRLKVGEDIPFPPGDYLYKQLEPFTVQVSTRFVENGITKDPLKNLILVKVRVGWKTKTGAQKEYTISQFIEGTGDDSFLDSPNLTLSAKALASLDPEAIATMAFLLGAAPDLGAIKAANPPVSGYLLDENAILDAGRVLCLLDNCKKRDADLIAKILTLESQRDALLGVTDLTSTLKCADLQRQVAEAYEQKSVNLVSQLLLLKEPLERLQPAFAQPQILGRNLSKRMPRFISALRGIRIACEAVQLSFSAAEKSYLRLIDTEFLKNIPRRKEPGIFRKVLDIQKIGVIRLLKRKEAIKDSAKKNETVQIMESLKSNIFKFESKYNGRFPNFTDYLAKERSICQTVATLESAYLGVAQAFEALTALFDSSEALENSIPGEFKNP
jgi:hypothetical protein